ncbi:MAG: Lrp/AsnC family transcriptional regulator [Salinivirgaceae bacterium]|jgi:DNA-binding Lrp family transcriptional regulator|nr:Lrp/AsnC family transcriptional regulator [Salinivirgaceae bacterium]
MIKLDDIDRKILKILQENGRITTKVLANEIHLSNTPVYERVKKLERSGVIRKYRAEIDPDKIGKGTTIFIMVSLINHTKGVVEQFKIQLLSFPEVMEFYYISGNHDAMIKVMVNDMHEFKAFIEDKLSIVENIYQFHSIFAILGEQKGAFDI